MTSGQNMLRPEYKALHSDIMGGLIGVMLRATLKGALNPKIKPDDVNEILVEQGIHLIATALLSAEQSADFDAIAADAVRVDLIAAMRLIRAGTVAL